MAHGEDGHQGFAPLHPGLYTLHFHPHGEKGPGRGDQGKDQQREKSQGHQVIGLGAGGQAAGQHGQGENEIGRQMHAHLVFTGTGTEESTVESTFWGVILRMRASGESTRRWASTGFGHALHVLGQYVIPAVHQRPA